MREEKDRTNERIRGKKKRKEYLTGISPK